MQHQDFDIIVIGAGPSGCILTRRLKEAGAHFAVLERNEDVASLWNIKTPDTPMYESAHFISSKTTSGFVDFPMPESYPDYPNHRQIYDYICSYADHFELRPHIQFSRSLKSAKKTSEQRWQLEIENGDTLNCRYLICANGVNWLPNEITWPGHFEGEIRHSVSYRDISEFKDKRVLIIGGGNSGVDIACDASVGARQAFLSLRRGYHFVPKFLLGKPSDVFEESGPPLPPRLEAALYSMILRVVYGDLTRYGLQKPDHRLFESHPILNTQILHYLGHGDCIAKPDVARFEGREVVFTDDSREEIDLVIYATGYRQECPFFADDILPTANGRPDLYLNMFPRNHQNLALLGFVEFASAAYRNFDAMAQLIVADATAGPDTEVKQTFSRLKQEHQPNLRGRRQYIDSTRHANYVDVQTFRRVLKRVGRKVGLHLF